MKVYSETTHMNYEPEDAVYYRNVVQAAWMLSKPDCVLFDVFESQGKIVFAFQKEFHKKYISEWAERKQKIENNN